MCRQVTCNRCRKTTWAGCGQHVDQVMKGVSPGNRCTCSQDSSGGGFFSKLFGR